MKNEQAFPSNFDASCKGITARDYFAIKIAPEIFNTIVKAPDFDPKADFKTIAKSAYIFADAMLKAREQQP